jgi:hypothetical protein
MSAFGGKADIGAKLLRRGGSRRTSPGWRRVCAGRRKQSCYFAVLRIAQGGAKAEAEIQRMIAEKVTALAEAQVAATVATLKGSKKHRVAKKALGVYAKRVRRNRRRLAK